MSEKIVKQVRSKYASAAASQLSSEHPGVRAVAEAFGYSPEELASIPAEANLGLSCGNPTAFAHLRPGEVVVDLGCGGGLDVLLAAQKVGPAGKAIGIDMTPEMIDRARRNAAAQRLANVDFHLAVIDKLPLADGSVDCIISNCVINLVPDKSAVFREMFRVLKPGGRLAISDIAIKRPLPEDLAGSMLAYIGCIAGAELISDYEHGLRQAGFEAVQIVDTGKDLNAYAQVENQTVCCSPSMQDDSGLSVVANCCSPQDSVHAGLAKVMSEHNINDFAASVQVYALKGS